MVFVVLTVPVVSGVQHVDCVTFSTLSFFLVKYVIREEKEKEKRKEKKRKREEEREREEEEEEEEEEQRERRGRGRGRARGRGRGRGRARGRGRGRGRKGCLCKRRVFLLLAPGSALEMFAAIVNPEKRPTKVNWTLSWPSALEICGKVVNKCFISDQILLGKVWALNLAIAVGKCIPLVLILAPGSALEKMLQL